MPHAAYRLCPTLPTTFAPRRLPPILLAQGEAAAAAVGLDGEVGLGEAQVVVDEVAGAEAEGEAAAEALSEGDVELAVKEELL